MGTLKMNKTIILSLKTLIFYAIIGLPISMASFYNLINGFLLDRSNIIGFGLFSMFGFLLFPLLLFTTYQQTKCKIEKNQLTIGKNSYPFSEHDFQILEKEKAFMERPLFSLWKKTYHYLLIKETSTGTLVDQYSLDIFKEDLDLLKTYLPSKQNQE